MSGLAKRIGAGFTFGLAAVGTGVAVVLSWTLGLLALAFLVTFFVKGPPWAIEHIFPWLQIVAKYAFLGMLAVLPFALFRRTRLFAAVALKIGGYVMGLNFWVWSIIATYTLAGGMLAVILGLVFGAGFGVVPLALVAALVKGEWEGALSWLVMLAACLVPNLLSAGLFLWAERDAERESTRKSPYRLRFVYTAFCAFLAIAYFTRSMSELEAAAGDVAPVAEIVVTVLVTALFAFSALAVAARHRWSLVLVWATAVAYALLIILAPSPVGVLALLVTQIPAVVYFSRRRVMFRGSGAAAVEPESAIPA